jgi:apolipoprotein N-acyltransferase
VDRRFRRRFWFEIAASSASAVLFGVTLVWPSWIEFVFHVDPDRGSGLLEWMIVLVSFAVSLCASVLARREWRSWIALTVPMSGMSGPEPPGKM